MDVANRLGFEPNRLARALATARSQTMGVVVHDVSDPYFAEIIRGLEDVAGPRDHALFVSSSDRDPAKEIALLRTFVANRVDAIILAASGLTDERYRDETDGVLSRFESQGGIVVAMSEHTYAAARVTFDNYHSTRAITGHLLDLGHRRIGYLAGPPELVVCGSRLNGYRSAVADAGLGPTEDLIEGGAFSMEGGARAAAILLDRCAPTAIVAGNDLMAIGAMRTIRDRGLRIPEDVSIAGFDDIEFASYAPVPLTTMRVPLTGFGRIGAQLALDLLDGDRPAVWPSVTPDLVRRSSTGPAPV